jgi:S-adenosylmethionine:tRNA ribosyltransferase-isomerase
LGTFAPVKTEKIKEHKMHSEFFEIQTGVINKIKAAKKSGRRIIAVGTTSCRTLESIDFTNILNHDTAFWTNIFIYPGYKFKTVDALITNFHLPKSTLLMLVSALASKKYIDRAYQVAVNRQYRFFSYGDAMFIY